MDFAKRHGIGVGIHICKLVILWVFLNILDTKVSQFSRSNLGGISNREVINGRDFSRFVAVFQLVEELLKCLLLPAMEHIHGHEGKVDKEEFVEDAGCLLCLLLVRRSDCSASQHHSKHGGDDREDVHVPDAVVELQLDSIDDRRSGIGLREVRVVLVVQGELVRLINEGGHAAGVSHSIRSHEGRDDAKTVEQVRDEGDLLYFMLALLLGLENVLLRGQVVGDLALGNGRLHWLNDDLHYYN